MIVLDTHARGSVFCGSTPWTTPSPAYPWSPAQVCIPILLTE